MLSSRWVPCCKGPLSRTRLNVRLLECFPDNPSRVDSCCVGGSSSTAETPCFQRVSVEVADVVPIENELLVFRTGLSLSVEVWA